MGIRAEFIQSEEGGVAVHYGQYKTQVLRSV